MFKIIHDHFKRSGIIITPILTNIILIFITFQIKMLQGKTNLILLLLFAPEIPTYVIMALFD